MRLKLLIYLLITTGIALRPVVSQPLNFGPKVESRNDPRIDSLLQVINQHQFDDEEKVKLLNDYARLCLYNYQFREGLEAAREARLLSDNLGFEGGKIMYNLNLSVFFGHQGDDMNVYYSNKAEWLSIDPDKQLSQYYSILPKVDFDSGRSYEELIAYFTPILKHFEQLEDKEIQACLLYKISGFNYKLGNNERAIEQLDRIKELYSELDQVYPMVLVTNYKLSTLKLMGNDSAAEKLEAELIDLVAKNQDSNAIGLIYLSLGGGYAITGRSALAIDYYLKAISVFRKVSDSHMLARTYTQMAGSYQQLNLYDKAVEARLFQLELLKKQSEPHTILSAYNELSLPYFHAKNYEKAREYMDLSLQDSNHHNYKFFIGRKYSLEGQILKDYKQYAEAIKYFEKAHQIYLEEDRLSNIPFMTLYLTECFYYLKDYDRALEYGLKCLREEENTGILRIKVRRSVSILLSQIYEAKGYIDKALDYLKIHQEIRAESERLDQANRIADAEVRAILERTQVEIDKLEEQKRQREQESEMQRLLIISIAGALLSAIILAIVLYRNNKNKQKANILLTEQKREIVATLNKLESTQSQLIHSEKMASLGELTAGIAHEIQNPLNFVNNFSEVNSELIDELLAEVKEGNTEGIEEIANDLKSNEDKIAEHGERASSIVKGMLQHSRTGSGEKEPTDLNAMADEYLRLAYHGLRAKDKSFNADFDLDLDEDLPQVNVVPQEIGRVLLNLINNAFHAVKNVDNPKVKVATKLALDKVEISISDNGSGIPDDIKDKIFQPFFTTKATGEGTGLGLSMSYDIITKGHGGKIIVQSENRMGTTFIIELPAHRASNLNS